MSTVGANGVELYYERHGSGPRLLFVNGSGMTIEKSRVLYSLFDPSFDFLTFDPRGLGRSSPVTRPYAMADCAADALAVMDAEGDRTGPPTRCTSSRPSRPRSVPSSRAG